MIMRMPSNVVHSTECTPQHYATPVIIRAVHIYSTGRITLSSFKHLLASPVNSNSSAQTHPARANICKRRLRQAIWLCKELKLMHFPLLNLAQTLIGGRGRRKHSYTELSTHAKRTEMLDETARLEFVPDSAALSALF